ELMRFVFKNRAPAKEIGRRAQADILRAFSPVAIGKLMSDRLVRLAELGKIPAPPPESTQGVAAKPKTKGFHCHLVERINHIVEANIPANARVHVVSKGDDGMLMFRGRQCWHFPQDSQGVYAGHDPADDSEAIGHLEALRHKGGEYL